MGTMTNYASAVNRIKKADTIEQLQKLEVSFDRLYNAGMLTVSELRRLDIKRINKIASLEG